MSARCDIFLLSLDVVFYFKRISLIWLNKYMAYEVEIAKTIGRPRIIWKEV